MHGRWTLSICERFEESTHEEDRGYITPCLVWTGTLDANGYGTMGINGKTARAHRVALAIAGIELIDGLEADHLCRQHDCVRCHHLEQVTHRENILRGVGIAAIHAAATHCPHGHEYKGDNLRVFNGGRWCITCKKKHDARARRRLGKQIRASLLPTPEGMKVCSQCRVSKPISEFYKCSQLPSGLRAMCKPCYRSKGW